MRSDSWPGDLTLANSRPGVLVRCVQTPPQRFMLFWGNVMGRQAFLFLPKHKELYVVRSNVRTLDRLQFEEFFKRGILLSDEKSRQPCRNPSLSVGGGFDVEPFFPFTCFDFVRGAS